MGDVCEGTAVHEGRRALERLHEVGLQGVLEQGGHGASGLELAGSHRLAGVGVAHDDAAQTLLEVGDVARKAQDRHDLGGNRDVEAVLARGAVGLAAQAVDDEAKLAVVHVDHALPGDAARVDAQGVALLDMVVKHGCEQVVRRADGMEVTREVQVDVFHGDDLGVAAAGSAALHTENRAQARLAQGDRALLAQARQCIGQADGGRRLALAGGGGVDGSDKHELASSVVLLAQQVVVDLCLGAAIAFQILLVKTELGGDFTYLAGGYGLGDLDVTCHGAPFLFGMLHACYVPRGQAIMTSQHGNAGFVKRL